MGLFSSGGPVADGELLALAREYEQLHIDANDRIERMAQYRAENDSARDLTMRDRISFNNDRSDYGRKSKSREPVRHDIPLPFGKAITVKHAYRIAGNLPDITVDRRDETPNEKYRSDTMEKIAWAIVRASSGDTAFASGAWDGSEVGSACFDLDYDIKNEIPVFKRVDPAGVIVVKGVDNPHDFQRVYRAWEVPLNSLQAEYRDQLFDGAAIPVNAMTASKVVGGCQMITVVQFSDKQRTVRFALGQGARSVVGLARRQHDFGFAPYVVIPNLGPYEDIWGWADYEFIRSLQAYIGVLFSREADVIRNVANGAVLSKGTGVNPEQIRQIIRDGGVVESRRDGTVDPIQVPDMPAFHEAHSERAMDMMKMLGFTPDAAWGGSGASSGSDRNLQLQPLVEYTAMKQLNWQAGMTRLFDMAYRLIEMKMSTSIKYRGTKPGKGGRGIPFVLTLGPNEDPITDALDPAGDSSGIPDDMGIPTDVQYPRKPKDIFDGDYTARFSWHNRINPDDPAFVTSEMAKFSQGAQSLQTTLERLGFQAPEDEMNRIEAEAKRFPWINQGMVGLIMAQLRGNAQGTGGGAPPDAAGAIADASSVMSGDGGGASGALDADAMTGMLPGASGQQYGGA